MKKIVKTLLLAILCVLLGIAIAGTVIMQNVHVTQVSSGVYEVEIFGEVFVYD